MRDALINSVVTLTLETIREGNSVLVFCSSRMMTVDTAVCPICFINLENHRLVRGGQFRW
jgi:replicative superfamily II helicase